MLSTIEKIRPERAKATRREWIGLGVIALPCLLYSMDLTVLNLAIPQISADVKPSAAQLLWIVDIYGFMVAGALITFGTLGDRIGRRKLLMIGAAAFGAASVLAAFAPTAELLIAARALLGLAAATLAPSTLSLIRNMFLDPKERTFAIGVWISSFSAGGAIGPLVGGLLLNYFWWGSVFLIAVPVMVALLVAAPIFLPEYRDPDAGKLDLPSAALSLIGVLAVIFGIKHVATVGVDGMSIGSIAIGAAVLGLFAQRQRTLKNPLIDLSLFRSLAFSASLGINILAFFAAFSIFMLVAQYLQIVLGLSPLAAGLWTAPSAAAFIFGSMFTSTLANRMRPSHIMAGGFAVASAGFLLLASARGDGALYLLVGAYFVISLGFAPAFTLATDLIIGTAPPERAGGAAGLAETSSEFGGALGIAVLGSVVTALYRGALDATMPAGIPPEAAGIARETVGGAVAEAERIAGPAGDALAAAAQAAFSDSFQMAALLCALVTFAAAIVAAAVLRTVRMPEHAE
jgi:DHA2 family multidrug resistance protein-like MFS transporter